MSCCLLRFYLIFLSNTHLRPEFCSSRHWNCSGSCPARMQIEHLPCPPRAAYLQTSPGKERPAAPRCHGHSILRGKIVETVNPRLPNVPPKSTVPSESRCRLLRLHNFPQRGREALDEYAD